MNILVIQGHPDSGEGHLCHALAEAYAGAAMAAGHGVRCIDVGAAPVTLLRSRAEWTGPPPDWAAEGQAAILWADHLVLVFPLWLGGMPARLKAWLEHVFREDFAFRRGAKGWERHLCGKSARIVVTMGMPAPVYGLWFGAHGTAQLSRSILGFSGIRPVRETRVGMVEGMSAAAREAWLGRMRKLGAKGG
ncbi:flavodoxin family protein [Frigidibacter albus]|uniref:Flavodoxin family protein n=1 Tax=Frigidibacter albus TaxID=1465486 RepID=A0A6L8VF68_9RHOB|nr:NAD(P)H-dependent oxidoreductase [Frigidibacter albus]MZQ88997.1 flavodoxin family protein [Frigidibacter albus]NBE30946.1 flavodoxin family protein [Frigidibacter albus]GGH52016.1 hypothetical protein GCM10011341_16120 [Frigidibacter albus]